MPADLPPAYSTAIDSVDAAITDLEHRQQVAHDRLDHSQVERAARALRARLRRDMTRLNRLEQR